MIDHVIRFSIKNKLIIGLFLLLLIGWGSYSITQVPLDAVPDITNNQIQVITQSPDLATQEVEQFITYPLEVAMSFIPDLVEIRSISRFGLSVITIVFEESVDPYRARQLVSEQIQVAREEIPESYGIPKMAPLVTGLSEIYQYTLKVDPEADTTYSLMDLRTIQDWIVKRQLAGVPGVAEVSSFGGYLKQFEVAIDPEQLRGHNLTLTEVYNAILRNNRNTGGSYIEKTDTYYFIRGEGMVQSLDDLGAVVVKTVDGTPILIRDIADLKLGHAPRFGALTKNANGETVGGLVLMLKGENSYQVTKDTKDRIEQIQQSLPPGVSVEPFLDRSKLIGRTIDTVTTNLIEGGLIVIFILVLLLGNLRAGIIVASVIPLSMLFALGMMNVFGVSANLMSLGAIDFGLIVDGAVIIVEAIVHRLYTEFGGQNLDRNQMDREVNFAASKIRKSAAFGEIIILIVYLPILALSGIEGKMFTPMAQTVSFAILGAFILSLTYVPMMSALFLNKKIVVKKTISDRIMKVFHYLYDPVIRFALNARIFILGVTIGLLVVALLIFNRLGGEFIPTLEEGDLALHQILPTGSSLKRSVAISEKLQYALMEEFPEIEKIVTKIGTSEIPTDPMPVEVGDIIVVLKDKDEWVSASTREELFGKIETVMNTIPGVGSEFSQPIQMRFNELMTGTRQDIAVKIFGENLDILAEKGNEANGLIQQIRGVGGTILEQVTGLPQIQIAYDRAKIAQYGVDIHDLNQSVNTAFSGGHAGVVFEGEKRFDLVVRFKEEYRSDIQNVRNLYISLPDGNQVPLQELADIQLTEAPAQISRENARRRIVIGVNTRDRDTESVVEDIQTTLDENLDLPAGYYVTFGGQFENLIKARERLSIAVPAALGLIFALLFFTFNSVKQALLIFTAVPLAAIGGVFSLWLRDMPFSISAGIGFIALFGVAVLNGIVLISYFNQLKEEGLEDIKARIFKGTSVRLRPVLMTASVASFGFLPMALSTSAGAEVQRPLATVVIGGLITATLLTMVVLPILYFYLEKGVSVRPLRNLTVVLISLLSGILIPTAAQTIEKVDSVTMDQAIEMALQNNPVTQQAKFEVKQEEALQKSSFDLGTTSLYFQKEETSSDIYGIQSIGIQQSIDFPVTYIKRSQYQQQRIELSEKKQALTKNQLITEVSILYQEALYARGRLRLMQRLDSIYHDFASAARLQYETGETNKLAWIAASGQQQRIVVRQEQALADYNIALNNLQLLLNSETRFQPLGRFERIGLDNIDPRPNTYNPYLAFHEQNTRTTEAALKIRKSEYLPSFNLGYASQTINEQGGFFLIRAGIDLPLFFWAQNGRTQAARWKVRAATEKFRTERLNWQRQYQAVSGELSKLDASLEYYEEEGLELAEEQIRTATLSYQNGDINYMAYIQNLQQAIEIQEEYLDYLKQYNQTSIRMAQLTGQLLENYNYETP